MPKLRTTFGLALATLAAAMAWPGTALAALDATIVDQAIKAAMKAARAQKADLSGFGVRADGMCLVGSFLKKGGSMPWSAKLKAGKEYVFVGGGDQGVETLLLTATADKELIAKDEGASPVVALTVKEDCDVSLRLKLVTGSATPRHFAVLIMLESTGSKGSLEQLEGAAEELNQVCAALKQRDALSFDQEENGFCLVGCLLGKGGWRSFDRSYRPGETYLLVGSGDKNCVDLDISVHKGKDVIAKDDATDAAPVVAVSVDEKTKCGVRLTMADAKRPSFAVCAILTDRKPSEEAPPKASSGWEGAHIDSAIKHGIAAAREAKNASGFGVRSDGTCLIGGFVEKGGALPFGIRLAKGKDYVFVGAGDGGVTGLTLEASEGKEVIAKDTDGTPTAVVSVEAGRAAEVTLRLKLVGAPEHEKHFVILIMLESNGSKGSLDQLATAARQLNETCAAVTKDEPLQLDQEGGTLCLVGALLGKGGSRQIDRRFRADESYLIVGSADENCVDLDLAVMNLGDDSVLAKDDEKDATPVVAFSTEDGKAKFGIKITMADAKRPSFAVVGIIVEKKKK